MNRGKKRLHNEEAEKGTRIIALAGNPNVGKSTIFNALTGMRQHTGNWPGKTVSSARGEYEFESERYELVDLPGTYSLMPHSAEEEIARNFICAGGAWGTVVVCDATCLERNLNLVIQTLEITGRAVVCINLMDEAAKKGIIPNFKRLSELLGVQVIGTSARSAKGLKELKKAIQNLSKNTYAQPFKIKYPDKVEAAAERIQAELKKELPAFVNARWIALRLLEGEEDILNLIAKDYQLKRETTALIKEQRARLAGAGLDNERVQDIIALGVSETADRIAREGVSFKKPDYNRRDRKLDKILTGKWTGIPFMLALLAAIFYITITGANYPSQLLADGLFWIQDRLTEFCFNIGMPAWLHGALVLGVYRVLAWVISVMLPPMAIFFPLFTLLEDFGYLPRVAFNLDSSFKKCGACGKQSLTMCMGLGCNAVGVTGCRIIDSPRERLIAIITNSFVPCNGRFPTIIAIISMFFVGSAAGMTQTVLSTLILTAVIVAGVAMTLIMSKLLSRTLLKGEPSSFTLELPPYRRPQIGKVIVRSVLDRTLFVLGRAAAVAAPAGLIIWIMANVTVGDATLLAHCSGFLEPFAHLLGLDGVILMAFILGWPANEIVVPIIIMAYMATGTITDYTSLDSLKNLLVDNGWTWLTAVCTIIFSLMHWPCSTTCITIKRETGRFKWTAAAFLLPTAAGCLLCFILASLSRLLGLAP